MTVLPGEPLCVFSLQDLNTAAESRLPVARKAMKYCVQDKMHREKEGRERALESIILFQIFSQFRTQGSLRNLSSVGGMVQKWTD